MVIGFPLIKFKFDNIVAQIENCYIVIMSLVEMEIWFFVSQF